MRWPKPAEIYSLVPKISWLEICEKYFILRPWSQPQNSGFLQTKTSSETVNSNRQEI